MNSWKYLPLSESSHPLREDVSWNRGKPLHEAFTGSHPLREDVSWNASEWRWDANKVGHPLREDVSWNMLYLVCADNQSGHPLREDVSWNVMYLQRYPEHFVILFVRMWVEISFHVRESKFLLRHPLREDVSWNVNHWERRTNRLRHPLREDVSWNVNHCERLMNRLRHPLREDVSWNIRRAINSVDSKRHPLREDVSWNIEKWWGNRWDRMSSSSWGCELKYSCDDICVFADGVILFVRMWVEIPVRLNFVTVGLGHPLREDVSWNKKDHEKKPIEMEVILFVRMWVEISKISK